MCKHSTAGTQRKWYDSAHASLCMLGSYLCATSFFRPIEEGVKIKQKVLKYSPIQKLEMLFVALLAGAKTVYQTGTTLRVDRALQIAFGLPGCAEQSVIADTLDAATEEDVLAMRQAIETIFGQHSRAQHHDFTQEWLILDIDLSPLPASRKAEGSERGYMGRSRSKTGRKLVRVRASQYQETLWEDVLPGRAAESLGVLQEAIRQAERLLGLEGEDEEAQAKRARTEVRLDSGWGGEEMINWLLLRGYDAAESPKGDQVTGKFKSNSRVQKLVKPIAEWTATSSPGREVAVVPNPVALARPTRQYAVRTPSKDKPGGYYHAVLFTTCLEWTMLEVVDHYDDRAGMESDLKGDKRGLGLAVLRKPNRAGCPLSRWASPSGYRH